MTGELFGLLGALGPIGVLAGGMIAVTLWVGRVSHRLDSLDHKDTGRVTKVERRVDEIEEDLEQIKIDSAVAANNTNWIKQYLERPVRDRIKDGV